MGSARQGGRRVGQPRRAGAEGRTRARHRRRFANDRRGRLPRQPGQPDHGAGHKAGARHLGRLRAAAAAQHLAPGPEWQVHLVAQLLKGRRRLGGDHHPWRIAPRFQLDPQSGLRSLAAGARHHRLVHERLV